VSLYDYGRSTFLNPSFTPCANAVSWTNWTDSVDGGSRGFSIDTGGRFGDLPNTQAFVRCVRGTICMPAPRMKSINSEAVEDRYTGLTWELNPSTQTYDWQGALAACAATSHAGVSGSWRLPTIKELASLLDYSQTPQVVAGGPTVSPVYVYLSSTIDNANPNWAFGVSFTRGWSQIQGPVANNPSRAVCVH
jgi:hypothetical protein